MNIKRIIWILVAVVVVSFGIGAFSLRYNDNLSFRNLTSSNGIINIGSDNNFKISSKGIQVMDGDSYVSIGWDGIKVIDGDEKVSIGWSGVKIDDGDKTKVDIGKVNWFDFGDDLEWFTLDEEKSVEINKEKNISVSSTFTDIEIIPENRKNIKVLYQGKMKANTTPKLEINKKTNEIEIMLVDKKSQNYKVTNSDVVMKVFVPKDYNENIEVISVSSDINIEKFSLKKLNLTSTSGDIVIHEIITDILKLTTTSGDVKIEDSSGTMDIETTSGDIKIYNKTNDKDIKIGSTAGDVYIDFAKDANYSIEATTTSGDIKPSSTLRMDWSEINNNYGKNSFKGEISGIFGKEGNKIEIKTISGDIKFNMD